MIKGRGGGPGAAEEDAAVGERLGPDPREADERQPASGRERESIAERESNLCPLFFSLFFHLPPSSDSVVTRDTPTRIPPLPPFAAKCDLRAKK